MNTKIKKIIFIFTILFILNIDPVYATAGRLRKASIKTCPNGVTYGLHSDGNGGTHWHQAVQDASGNYYPTGETTYYDDPCPSSTTNQDTAPPTNSNNSQDNSSSNNNNSNINQNNESNTQNQTITQSQSNNTEIKQITINDDIITEIKDEIEYTSTINYVEIEVQLEDDKATYKIDGITENLSKDNINNVKIQVTAEDGTKKEYTIKITFEPQKSNIKILEFKVNDEVVEFDFNNKASISVLNNVKKFNYTFKLSDTTASLKLFQGEKELSKDIELSEGQNQYRIEITDSDGNVVNYELEIERMSQLGTIITTLIVIFFIIIVPITVLATVIISLYKQKKKNMVQDKNRDV